MSDSIDEQLVGLLTDLIEAVSRLNERLDAAETRQSTSEIEVAANLATIAEIATRTYYATRPTSPLPDTVIDSALLTAMIDHWPRDAVVAFTEANVKSLQGLRLLDDKALLSFQSRIALRGNEANALRLRRRRAAELVIAERNRRKANDRGRSR